MRFLTDRTVGRLTKWLRAMGYDCESLAGEEGIRPFPEGRVLITRKRKRGKDVPPGLPCVVLQGSTLAGQLQEMKGYFPNLKEEARWFSRCLRCNTPIRDCSRESIRGKVPDYVYETHRVFKECPTCRRLYWEGSHPKRMKNTFHSQ